MGGICSRKTETENNRRANNNRIAASTTAQPYNLVIVHNGENATPVIITTTYIQNNKHADILMIDSSHCLLKMNAMMLAKCGHTVRAVDNSEEALDIIKVKFLQTKKIFDVILVNINLKYKESGIDIVKQIRKIEKEFDVKHKVIIGTTCDLISHSIFAEHFDKIILKPYKTSDINNFIF